MTQDNPFADLEVRPQALTTADQAESMLFYLGQLLDRSADVAQVPDHLRTPFHVRAALILAMKYPEWCQALVVLSADGIPDFLEGPLDSRPPLFPIEAPLSREEPP